MTTPDRQLSPDGSFAIETTSWEARMSHWIETPRIVDATTRAPVFAFASGSWSLDRAVWTSPHVAHLQLRKYPGNHTPSQVECTIDCEAHTATLGTERVPLAELEQRLDATLRWS